MTQEKSPLKGFRSIGGTPPSPNNDNSLNQSTQNYSENENIDYSESQIANVGHLSNKPIIEQNICPSCGKENDKTHSFCSFCGSQLDKIERSSLTNQTILCPSCGNTNPLNAITCNSCGNNLSNERSFTPPPSYSNDNASPESDPFMMPPPVAGAYSEPKQSFTGSSNKRFPTVSTKDYKNMFKNGKVGLLSIPILFLIIVGLIIGGFAIGLTFERSFQELSIFGFILMGLGYLIHAGLGFVGLFRLFYKGWTLEVLGCMFIGGGSPLLFPVLFGILFYIFAEILPNKHK